MTLRVTTKIVTYAWGETTGQLVRYGQPQPGNLVTLPAGAMIDVPPGSALEAAIGAGNLRPATAAELGNPHAGTSN